MSGDGLTIMRAHEVAYFRLTDRFGHLGGMLFLFGMFHFYWFCLCILFQIMWLFGFEVLVARLNKAKRVTKECKKFNDADQFFTLVYDSFFLYALDEFSLQYENLGYECSWRGFDEFMARKTPGVVDEVRDHWCEFFMSYGWWYLAARAAVRQGDGKLQFILVQAWLPLFVWFGHCHYKTIMATYILNSLFLWKPFWVDLMRRNASIHGCVYLIICFYMF